jgi:hypothetical protein
MPRQWRSLESDITDEATAFGISYEETQEWITAWKKTYERLELTEHDVDAFNRLMEKIRWGFLPEEIESFSPKERSCLRTFQRVLVDQANRLFGNKSKMDPIAASYLGGRRQKIRREEYETIRRELRELRRKGIAKGRALAQIRQNRRLNVSLKTLERICQDRADHV